MKGLTHIYTGDGKGKTTASVGLAARAAGAGLHVLFVQFLKGRMTGELASLEKLGVDIIRSNTITKFIPDMSPEEKEECRITQQDCLKSAERKACNYDIIILDEAIGAAAAGMIEFKELIEFVKTRPEEAEMVITGRNAQPQLIELADYVSEIKSVKHPYDKKIGARKGIEY